jgi:hypothetical protein
MINFGTSSSTNSRSQLNGSDGNTSYRFKPGGSTGPNEYAIAPQSGPSAGFYRLWHDVPDHTPNDQLGNMMILDLNTAGITIYSKSISTGICPNTTYEFSAWMASLLKPGGAGIFPNVTFIIRDGKTFAILATVDSGPMPETSSINWQQKGVLFSTGTTTGELVLEIVCKSSGTAGNDLAIDDISFRPCLATVDASFPAGSNGIYCEGSPVMLDSKMSNGKYNDPVYQWQSSNDGVNWTDIGGAVNTTYGFSNATTSSPKRYRILAAERGNLNPTCSGSSNELPITVIPPAQIKLPASIAVCQLDSFIEVPMSITVGNANRYLITSDMPGNSLARDSFSASRPLRIVLPANTPAATYHFTIAVNDSNYNCRETNGNFNVVVAASPDIIATNTTQTICSGEALLPIIASNPNGIATQPISWSRTLSSVVTGIPASGIGSISGALTNATMTNHTVEFTMVAKNANCTSEVKALVTVAPSFNLYAGADTVLPLGVPVKLSGRGPADLTYQWTATPAPLQANDLQTLSPFFTLASNTRFILTASSNGRCMQSDTLNAKVVKGPDIYVPSGFVPGGVSNTNGFAAIPVGIAQFYFLKVFNRWGQLLFSTSDAQKGWDGKWKGIPQPMGVYVWMTSGKTGAGETLQKRGTVTMIR